MEREGVIQFQPVHTDAPLPQSLAEPTRALLGWRKVLVALGLIGCTPARYGGLGFGNVSLRIPPFRGPRGQASSFLITGTQSACKEILDLNDLCVVDAWDLSRNRIHSRGRILPSSESLTHGAIYDTVPGVGAVVHVHTPIIFQRAASLALPTTHKDIGYGTQAMAQEISRLWRETDLRHTRVLVMAGHQDGVISFGPDLDDACARMITVLAAAERKEP